MSERASERASELINAQGRALPLAGGSMFPCEAPKFGIRQGGDGDLDGRFGWWVVAGSAGQHP